MLPSPADPRQAHALSKVETDAVGRRRCEERAESAWVDSPLSSIDTHWQLWPHAVPWRASATDPKPNLTVTFQSSAKQ